ncbi:glycosyltransferase family 4 protein [Anabaena sp. PCC 7108]|uniref:glycosyltransferase family 4 protein n=1 Tax=Anabaena sp. PCC 7108 TaxID=163908 RepID=UPI000364A031|nr:glycosyltransferase family 4 protein [Anabaena sp. PCC 7108]
MKILFCSPIVPSKELGMSKVLIELIEELQELGWLCKLLSPTDICPDILSYTGIKYQQIYSQSLKNYLHEYASEYDVIDYDHVYLPYSRDEFINSTLFVARSVLLVHHYETLTIPIPNNLKGKIANLIKRASRKAQVQNWIRDATLTIREADLVNVSNDDDKTELIRRGIPADKISVIPYGISQSRRLLFDNISSLSPVKPTVAFIGTFDPRKGSNDFPKIVQYISEVIPNVKFRLMGGRYKTEKEVLGHFHQRLRNKIEVISNFDSEELPKLLATCSVGIFPSYLEGFGFGVLEMLAASIPVIAYDVPGPPMMLPPEYLVPRGDIKGMSDKVINLLHNQEKLQVARLWAKQQSQKFSWQHIAQITSETYLRCLESKRTVNKTTRE